MRSRILAIAILVVLTTLAAAGCSPASSTPEPIIAPTPVLRSTDVIAVGRLEPAHFADLSLNADGAISDLLVHEGEEVEAGQMLARVQNAQAKTLSTAQAEAASRLAQAYQAQRTAQTQLDDFDIPSKFSGMTVAEAAKLALLDLDAARTAFKPYEGDSIHKERLNKYFATLPRRIVVDTGEYRPGVADELHKTLTSRWHDYRSVLMWMELQSALETAEAQLVQAQKDYDNLQDTSLAEGTAGTRAALANAELRAPFAGTITNLDLKVGEFAASGTPVVTMADFSSWVVKTTDLTEIDVVNLKEGQPVSLTLDAIPEATLKGYVLSIGQNYSEKQGDIVYKVTVLLTDQNPAMRWGMTAQIRFATDSAP